jgi:hypothetical protein
MYAGRGSTNSKAAGHVEPTALLCRPSTKPFARAVATGLSSQSFRSAVRTHPVRPKKAYNFGAPDGVVFWQRQRIFRGLKLAPGLTNVGSEVEHERALAGGLAMGAYGSGALSARSSLGSGCNLRCDHCREEVGNHPYWHMYFCSAECMTAYLQRLAPQTKVKISQLETSRQSLEAA